MSSIYGSWTPCEAFRALQDHYRMGRAPAMREDMHIHFKQAAQCLPIPEKWVAKTIGQSFSEYIFLRELEGSTPLAERGFGTVPAQCPRSARTVPATVPAWKLKQCPRFFRFLKENGNFYTS